MVYPKTLTIFEMKNICLFDNIHYKYIKNIIHDEANVIEVEIEDLPCDRELYCKTQFKFINTQCVGRTMEKNYYKDRKFAVVKEYNISCPYHRLVLGENKN